MTRTVYVNGARWIVRDTVRNPQRRLANRIVITVQGTFLWAPGTMRCRVVSY